MPTFERGDVSIYYEEYGSGYPLLLFAPGGMRSSSASSSMLRRTDRHGSSVGSWNT